MPSPYFLSVDPSPGKLRMFFGRRQEIQATANHLQNGDSVLLVGERRMGKTFLLYMIGDSAGMGADFYEHLLDRQTGALLAQLRRSTASYHWAYVDLLGVTSVSGFYFQVLAQLAKGQADRLAALSSIDSRAFMNELTGLSNDLSCRGQRAVVLVDECEKLFEMGNSADAFGCLKGIIQRCNAVNFLLAGDIKPHQTSPEFQNLQGVLHPIYLAPLDLVSARELVQAPVEGNLLFEESAIQQILELTGCKPCLVQILCSHLYESITPEVSPQVCTITLAEFNRLWESGLRSKIFEAFDAPLRDFFNGLQGDEQKIFSFLAHNPLATGDDIVAALGIEVERARRGLERLSRAHRIVGGTTSGFRISAKIVEEFGSRFVACPGLGSPRMGDGQPGGIKTLQDMIMEGEGAALEFKSSLRWDYYRHAVHEDIEGAVIKTLAAFLNTNGGTLVIGVDDEGRILGLENDYSSFRKKNRDGFELHLMALISRHLGKNVCAYIHLGFYTLDRLEVCKVDVGASPFPVYAGEKAVFYIRTGNQTQDLNSRETVEYVRHHWHRS